jgi:hypothetical protein
MSSNFSNVKLWCICGEKYNTFNSLVLQKALASDDGLDQVPQALLSANHFLADPIDAWPIATIQFTADRVGEHFLGETAGEGVVLRDNDFPGHFFGGLFATELVDGCSRRRSLGLVQQSAV